MRVVVLQPGYLPWLGFFDQLDRSDMFVLYDDVQFDKHGWRNRNRIKTRDGPMWLTVPVRTKGLGKPRNDEVEIDPTQHWAGKHLQAIRTWYGKAPHFARVFAAIEEVLSRPWARLLDLDRALMDAALRLLGLERRVFLASELGIGGGQTARLVAICRHLGADRYLTGDAAKSYLDEGKFTEAGISVEWHGYKHPRYRQLHGEFVPYLSIVDLLMNHGAEALGILTGRLVVEQGAVAHEAAPEDGAV
ncbi:MAG: WbqC family protein [Planctomycetota bacterium]